MPERIPQSATIRVPIQAFLSSDHVTPATGKTIAITISKNGAAYGNPSAGATNAVEIASGSYYVDLSTTDTGTVGPLFVLGSVATVDPVNILYNVAADATTFADTLLDRNMTTGADSGSPTVRTVRQALRFLRNKWDVAAGTLTVKKEDDTTTSWTATLSSDAAAVPIIGSDPAS